MNYKAKGKVLIIGGGISGIEAALGLSSLGYGIYLVERSDHLGGMIPDLHRIYPVCSCCKLDPMVYACQQDPNIKVLLKTKVESVSGSIGNFRVSLDSPGERISIDVAGIVLASGIELFDPSGYENYAYFHPNVITSLEYEQLQKPLGSDNGIIKRASDGKVPSKIAWIQCVGSRDINRCDAPYCSSVCCMYALKEAINTKEMNEDIDTVILYMDMRAHGKGFEQYLNKALNLGVRLVRCRIHTIDPDGDDIYIRFVNEEGKPCVERFDLAVLSVGLRPSKEAIELAKRMGLELDNIGFIRSDPFSPGKTNIPGIFVCGGASGPYDIRQSIYQADSVSATISTMIEPEPFEVKAVYPEIRDISNEKPRLVFAYYVCDDMGEEIEGYIEESLKNEPRILKSIKIKDDI
ncbi:MAG TPA: CoB--CoM heterodisulfide reductase iron-sulfur subunit A family protein, partial [Desulfobacteraceae bacterium]|nr:CoB--CoM heterodisulfide reductase iron-sulfur subunit A family protein [Desulfobacteraceae bacterium]